MSAAQTRVEWTGNIQVHHPVKPADNHQLVVDPAFVTPATHTCTGCTWTVETYTPLLDPTTLDAIREAFAKHLLTTALAEP